MSSNATVSVETGALDVAPERYTISIDGAVIPETATADIQRNLGKTPSQAVINLPTAADERDAENSDWFFGHTDIRIGAEVEIYLSDLALFRGHVVKIKPDNPTGVAVLCYDARWKAQGRRILGTYILTGYTFSEQNYEETGPTPPEIEFESAEIKYRASGIPIFNPEGRPNCIVWEGQPVFAPFPDFNLEAGDDPGEPQENKAEYWTLEYIIDYVLWAYGAETDMSAAGEPLNKLPGDITIPEGIASSISDISQSDFGQGRSQGNQNKGVNRKGRQIQANGIGVIDFVQDMLDIAGGNSIYLMPNEEGADLQIIPTWYYSEGMIAYCAASGNMKAVTRPAFQLGGFEEDGIDVLTSCSLAGQSIYVERRVHSDSTDPGSEYGLRPGWSSKSEYDYKKYVKDNGYSTLSLKEAAALYPQVGVLYKIELGYDYTSGLVIAGDLTAPIAAPRAVLPNQISVRALGEIIDYIQAQYPLYVEVKIITDWIEDELPDPPPDPLPDPTYTAERTWVMAHELSGLQVLDDSRIYIPGIRDIENLGWNWKKGKSPSNPFEGDLLAIEFNPVRLNLAFQSDDRLIVEADNEGMADVPRLAEGLERTDFIYSPIYRKQIISEESFPLPETTIEIPDPAVEDLLFNDEGLALGHVGLSMLEQGRLRKSGTLIYEGGILDLHPGIMVSKINDVNSGSERMVNGVIGSVFLSQGTPDRIASEFTFV